MGNAFKTDLSNVVKVNKVWDKVGGGNNDWIVEAKEGEVVKSEVKIVKSDSFGNEASVIIEREE